MRFEYKKTICQKITAENDAAKARGEEIERVLLTEHEGERFIAELTEKNLLEAISMYDGIPVTIVKDIK
jgi:hypothetical protein